MCLFGYICVNKALFEPMFTDYFQEEQEYETVMENSDFDPFRE